MLLLCRKAFDSKSLIRLSKLNNLNGKTGLVAPPRRHFFYEQISKNNPYKKHNGLYKNGRKVKEDSDEHEWEDKRPTEVIKLEQKRNRNLDQSRIFLEIECNKIDWYDRKMHPKEAQDWHYKKAQQGLNVRKEELTTEMSEEEWDQPLVDVDTFTWRRYWYDIIMNPSYKYEAKDELFYFAFVFTSWCVLDLSRKKVVNYYRKKKLAEMSEEQKSIIEDSRNNIDEAAKGRNYKFDEHKSYEFIYPKIELLAYKEVWNQAIKDNL